MNKVIMMGRLVKDPEVRYTQGDTPVAVGRFSIAVNRRFKREGQPDADFFNCTAFGKAGEFAEKYLHKGMKIVIEGSLQNDNYTDRNGVQRYNIIIMVDQIEFAESKREGNEAGGGSSVNQPSVDADGFAPVADDDLPFAINVK